MEGMRLAEFRQPIQSLDVPAADGAAPGARGPGGRGRTRDARQERRVRRAARAAVRRTVRDPVRRRTSPVRGGQRPGGGTRWTSSRYRGSPGRCCSCRRRTWTSAASSAARSTARWSRRPDSIPDAFVAGQRLPLAARASSAACTSAPAPARRSWCAARTARSSTWSSTCGPDSPTYRNREYFDLTGENQVTVYVPAGCAHGFQALTDPADVSYRIDRAHDPCEDVSIAFDDPDLDIAWPLPVTLMSDRDKAAPITRPGHCEADMTKSFGNSVAANKRLHGPDPRRRAHLRQGRGPVPGRHGAGDLARRSARTSGTSTATSTSSTAPACARSASGTRTRRWSRRSGASSTAAATSSGRASSSSRRPNGSSASVPTAEMVKFAKNGSDATTAAVKLARAVTGRPLVAICSDHAFFSIDDWFIAPDARCRPASPTRSAT